MAPVEGVMSIVSLKDAIPAGWRWTNERVRSFGSALEHDATAFAYGHGQHSGLPAHPMNNYVRQTIPGANSLNGAAKPTATR